jgi:hypothetical protein
MLLQDINIMCIITIMAHVPDVPIPSFRPRESNQSVVPTAPFNKTQTVKEK